MLWAYLSILAAFVWAIGNVVDKFILEKWIRKPAIPVLFLGVIGLIASIFIYFIKGYSYLSLINILLAFVAGIFYITANIFYFKAAKIEEISRVIPYFHLAPLFVLILAAIFLGERFTPITYLGIFLLMMGAVLISSKNLKKFSFGKPFRYVMLSVFLFAVSIIIRKYLLGFADFWTVFAYIRVGSALALVPLFYYNFKELRQTIKKHGKKVAVVISANETINMIAMLLFMIAMVSGFVTLVEALTSTESFFVLFFTVILSILFPKILKEEISRKTILIKLVAIVIMFIGALLIT